ncbi:hypothetical protein QQS21_007164 [Conoideocrella luteorostrata]|uniref:MFS transporter n=1 Tax=Conoideocrella luteorostrata TaxID=1105319 RepID=A0AAJ0FXN1_9HYPO|nr:hypothetical protein QQS21_007164 [Conoideocrella luteorostrata]
MACFSRCTVPVAYLLPFFGMSLFVTQLGLSLSNLSSIKLMQDIVCKQLHGSLADELLPEESCHGPEVQRVLNQINMGISISMTLGSALVAFPLGILADRIGRVPILGASVFSLFLTQAYGMLVCWKWKQIPLRAIWAIGGMALTGGGQRMAEAMVFTIIADVAPRSKRAPWFQWVTAAVLSGELAGAFLSGRLVERSIWLPLYISLALILFGDLLFMYFTPETLPKNSKKIEFMDADSNMSVSTSPKHAIKSIFCRPNVLLLPGAVLALPISASQSQILLLFMPIQFQWSFSESVLLTSLRSVVMLITLLIVLPGISYICTRTTRWPPLYRERLLNRTSTLVCMIGSLLLTMVVHRGLVISGVAISALGAGIPTLCRSMLVTAAGAKDSGALFGVLAFGEMVGFLGSTLAMGASFDVALTSWIGMPFALATVFSGAIFLTSWLAGTTKKEKEVPI